MSPMLTMSKSLIESTLE